MKKLSEKAGFLLALLFTLALTVEAFGQDDVADVPSEKISIKVKRSDAFYILIGSPATKASKELSGLAIIMPGGPGRSESFVAFIKRIYKFVLKEKNYIVALPDASHGTSQNVWPTEHVKVKGMKYSTEEYVHQILQDVSKRRKIDPKRVVLMAWSSSGPAAYSISFSNDKVRGCYILMSVAWKEGKSKLKGARGKAYYLEHSPEDQTCPFWHAKMARKELEKKGAKVTLVEYEGGHRFPMGVYPRMSKAFDWLEKETKTGKSR